jgi:hypothetical protein
MPRHARPSLAGGLAALLTAAACANNGPDFPDGGAAGCNPACTAPEVCDPASRSCVPDAEIDAVAPSVVAGSASITALARAGGRVTARFELSEAVASTPEVRFGVAGVFTLVSQADRSWTFDYDVAGTEPEGEIPVTVGVSDAAGNRASELRLGTVTLDFTSPRVDLATAAPPVLGAGASLTYVVEVSEPLGGDGLPMMTVSRDGVPVPDGLGAPTSRTATAFTWHRPGDALAEGAYSVAVTLADPAGNAGDPIAAAGFVVDRTAPSILALAVSAERVRSGADLFVTFEATESLGEPPLVRVGDREATFEREAALRFTYRFVPDEQRDAEGPAEIVVRVTDQAGNAQSARAAVELDFTPPGVATSVASPQVVALGDELVWTLTTTEPLDGLPELTVSRDGFEQLEGFGAPAEGSATRFSWTLPGAALADGRYEIAVALTDGAGNRAESLRVEGFFVDRRPPEISELSAAPRLRGGAPAHITFAVSESLAVAPVVTVAGREAELEEQAGRSYRFRFVPDPLVDPEGGVVVSVAVRDVAGNSASALLAIETDFTPPALSASRATPTVVSLGADLAYALEVSEPLGGDGLPALVVTRDGEPVSVLGAATRTTTGFAWNVPGSTLPDGEYEVAVRLTDLAGNSVGPVAAAGFVVDRTAPQVRGLAADRGRVRSGAPVELRFAVSEALSEEPVVTVAGRAATVEAQLGRDYTCRFVPDARLDPEGLARVVVSARDLAGNVGSASIFIEADYTPPSLSASQATPAVVSGGDDLSYTLEVSELLPGVPVLAVARDGVPVPALFGAPSSRTATRFTWSVPGLQLADGSYSVGVQLTDTADNVSATLPGAGFTVDRTSPSVLELSTDRGRIRSGDALTIRFAVSEVLSAAPIVTVAGRAAMLEGRAGLQYTYRFVPEDERDPEGPADVQVSVRDVAGNAGAATLTVALDFTGPALVASMAAPMLLSSSDDLTYVVEASEPLAGAPTLAVFRDGALETGLLDAPTAGTTTEFTWRRAGSTIADGTFTVAVTLTDLAGNVAVHPLAAGFRVDRTAPRVTVLRPSAARVRGGAPFTIRIEASEAIDGPPEVTVAGRAASVEGLAEGRYAATFEPDRARDPEGPVVIAASVRDLAGNTGSASGSVEFDFTPPTLVSASVGYVPEETNPLGVVSVARAGTRVTVTVVATEPLGRSTPPRLTLSPPGGAAGVTLDAAAFDASEASFEWAVPAAAADGSWTPALAWSDVAGNVGAASFAAPAIRVRTSTPTLAVDQTRVTYLRSPWGNSAPESRGAFTMPAGPYFALAPADPLSGETSLPGAVFQLAEGSPTRVRVWSSATAGTLLGTLAAEADGGWPRQRLVDVDVPRVWASGVDEAGNESARVLIGNAEWIASPNPPAGTPSPHPLVTTTVASTARLPVSGSSSAVGERGHGADGSSLLATAEAAWRDMGPGEALPSARYSAALAYDVARARVVLFGGYVNGEAAQDTWEWDGRAWTDCTPGGPNPPSRGDYGMAYDSARGRVVLFGGNDAFGGSLQDTWEWDGAAWVDRTPAGSKPSARGDHELAYDAARGRVVLFGGSSNGVRQDTWEWDGASWTDRTPVGPGPAGRYAYAMAYDAARARVVLHGGNDAAGRQLGDTWEWDGSDWVERTPAGARPAARVDGQMAYDAARERLVFFGGFVGGTLAGIARDVWEWDGSAWVERTPATLAPAARGGHAMAYDAESRRIVVFGGNVFAPRQDLWEWDGSAWTDATPAAARPAAREGHALAWDAARRRIVLFGGRAGDPLGDTWEWDGRRWVDRTPAGAGPAARSGHALVWDATREQVFLFGGRAGEGLVQDTWEWDGAAWTERAPAGARPAARAGHALAFDSARARVVLFGGLGATPRQDTWEWDGAAWVDRTPAGVKPPAATSPAMAFDVARDRVVLFGGGGDAADTWEWDGTSWSERTPAGARPSARAGAAMAWDAARARVVLVGGDAGGPLQDLWEWDGAAWTERTLTGARPPARLAPVVAYDAARSRLVLFGGSAGALLQDTWERDSSVARQSAFHWTVALGTLGVSDPAITLLRLRALCGGRFSPYSGVDSGATLDGWVRRGERSPLGGWELLATNGAGLAASEPWLAASPAALLEWSSASPADARRLVLQRDGRLALRCRPSGLSGAGDAQVALDYIEARVRYRTD